MDKYFKPNRSEALDFPVSTGRGFTVPSAPMRAISSFLLGMFTLSCANSQPPASLRQEEIPPVQGFPPEAAVPPSAKERARLRDLGPLFGCSESFPISNRNAHNFNDQPQDRPPKTHPDDPIQPPPSRLPAPVIQQIIRARFDSMRACYEPRLHLDPELEGLVSVHFAIDLEGQVTRAEIFDNTIPDCYVGACLLDVFRELEFPKPEGGIVTVTYPIHFSPG